MTGILELPELDESREIPDQQAFNLEVWRRVLADSRWEQIPGRIETNQFGQIIMSPPSRPEHGRKQLKLGKILDAIAGGFALTECPVSTSKGVRACDAAWVSDEREQMREGREAYVLAPEICVEVLSPTNSRREMDEKKALFFEAGAEEVWFCEQDGSLIVYLNESPETPAKSRFIPELPGRLSS